MPGAVPARRAFVVFIACAMAFSLVATLSSPVRAATFTVNSTADAVDANPGDGLCDSDAGAPVVCTLRAAIEEANALAGPDIINVPAGTYLLVGQLQVAANGSLTITGAGAPTTIVDGGAASRVFQLDADSVVNMSGLTIRNGAVTSALGAGIWVLAGGSLNLADSVVSGNIASGTSGGGIFLEDDASAVLSGTTVSGNKATFGAGIFVDIGASLALNASSSVSGNGSEVPAVQGGGIYNAAGEVTVTASSVTGNHAVEGGGIYNTPEGTVTVTGGSVISGNFVIVGQGGGDGAGIWNNGLLTITNSTISGNAADHDGGGIFNREVVDVVNSTISGNSADNWGGGIYSAGDVDLEFVTVASNTADRAGGIWVATGAVHLFASIVANNTGTDLLDDANCNEDDGDVDSEGNNLSSDASCEFDQLSDHLTTPPLLGVLANNGGPTQTHALLTGSPAIDAVQLVAPQLCPATDQRGIARPQDGDRNGTLVCDIGAYELVPSVISINDISVTEGNSGTVDAVFTVTLLPASPSTITVAYATANGSATAVADYQAATGTVTFLPGDVSETITVRVVGDTIDEPDETFVVNLSAAVGATIADAQGIGTILDDDAAPTPTPTPTPVAAALPDAATAGADGSAASSGWLLALGLLLGIAAVSLRRSRSRAAIRGR